MKLTKSYIKQLSFEVIGAAIEVHRVLGSGLLEEIYRDFMAIELSLRGIKFEIEKLIAVDYKGHELKRTYRQDLIVEDCIIVELKAVDALHPIFKAKLATYM